MINPQLLDRKVEQVGGCLSGHWCCVQTGHMNIYGYLVANCTGRLFGAKICKANFAKGTGHFALNLGGSLGNFVS